MKASQAERKPSEHEAGIQPAFKAPQTLITTNMAEITPEIAMDTQLLAPPLLPVLPQSTPRSIEANVDPEKSLTASTINGHM